MKTTIEEINDLMIPRYKVIADYPNSPHRIGEVYKYKKKFHQRHGYYENANRFSPHNLYSPEKYPAIFQHLEWWEERKDSEMPKYVKAKVVSDSLNVFEVKNYVGGGQVAEYTNGYEGNCYYLLPATEEEFNSEENRTKAYHL